jgi:hypothetical protein
MSSYLNVIPSAFPKSRRIVLALAAAILVGCDGGPVGYVNAFENEKLKPAEVLAQPVPPVWYEGELPILRVQLDRIRERGWILTPEGVRVFDIKTRQTTGTIPLPGWQWVGETFSCLPALALGPKGEALISSNAVATLWRIDPETLAVSKHEPVLDADTDKDVGFTGLAYSAEEEAFFAVSDYGALWRIDPLFARAQKIALSAPIPKACGVAIRATVNRFFGLCVHGPQGDWTVNRVHGQQGGWTVSLAPGGSSGHVVARSCAAAPLPSLADAGRPVHDGDLVSNTVSTSYREWSGP